jgi:hypothetical protein
VSEGGWGPAGAGQPAPEAGQPASGGDDRGSSVRSKVIIAAVAVAVGIAGGALWVGLAKGPSTAPNSAPVLAPSPPEVTEVQLERTSSAGESPFMSPVGQDQSSITAPANTGGEFLGDTPGLFADTGDKPSCDAQTLIANLNADPAKASAWATALGLQSKDIPTYVPSLTPVVLRSDTAVTNHGYADGRFFAYPAVLQAGTAVFINSYGEPKAKCFSGNPLTQPMSNPQASYVGPAWEQFAPKSVTIIHRPPTVIKNYIFVDVHNGKTVRHKAPPQRIDDHNSHCHRHPKSSECRGHNRQHTGDQESDDSEVSVPINPPPNTNLDADVEATRIPAPKEVQDDSDANPPRAGVPSSPAPNNDQEADDSKTGGPKESKNGG